ncbi:unnamed protein product [Trichobilharzia regenti]|nr:unnamed protein product [Trichobilharzia regenti]
MIRLLLGTIDIEKSDRTYTVNTFSPTQDSSLTPTFQHEAQQENMPIPRVTQDGSSPPVNFALHSGLIMDNIRANLPAAINTQLATSSQPLDTECSPQIITQL